jgi:hypothetical protein
MKIFGETPKANLVIIPIPRGNDTAVIFKAQAVLDNDDFDKLCPMPIAPTITRPGKPATQDVTDKVYLKAVNEYSSNKLAWMVIKSLEATEGLEWDTIELNDPDTWSNYEQELREGGFSEAEIMHIINGVIEANGLSDDKIDEARNSFLAGRLVGQDILSYLKDVPLVTQSGERVNDSD